METRLSGRGRLIKRFRRHLPKGSSSQAHPSRFRPASTWRSFIIYQDDETKELSGAIGEAEDLEECNALIDDEAQCHRSDGRTIVGVEIGKMRFCAGTNGEIPKAKFGERSICLSGNISTAFAANTPNA